MGDGKAEAAEAMMDRDTRRVKRFGARGMSGLAMMGAVTGSEVDPVPNPWSGSAWEVCTFH